MKEVFPHHDITQKTLAILPSKSIHYGALVLEENRKILVNQTPLEILKTNCLYYFSSYDGRREAVRQQLGYKRKVPIPISPSQHLLAFPTHSPEHYDCTWLFYHNIFQVVPHAESSPDSPKSKVIFKSGKELDIDVSCFVLEKQVYRAGMCERRFSGKRGGFVSLG
ncbi:competence protein ComK [Ornithinibacillus sp. FSL M8-0202]|uniref:competence protein ComK n=1 Tax=Ornithinibacillus sp. FSL M8-0202 TaxID=2921616 RepID=UPI0030D19A5E